MPAWLCSSISSGCGQPCSTASRKRCSDPTPGLPPHEKISCVGAPGADQLVVDHVGRHAHEGEVAPALADDLVTGGVRDQVGEALHRDGVAVVDGAATASPSATISAISSCPVQQHQYGNQRYRNHRHGHHGQPSTRAYPTTIMTIWSR